MVGLHYITHVASLSPRVLVSISKGAQLLYTRRSLINASLSHTGPKSWMYPMILVLRLRSVGSASICATRLDFLNAEPHIESYDSINAISSNHCLKFASKFIQDVACSDAFLTSVSLASRVHDISIRPGGKVQK